ncbi:sporulation protein Cse60 [Paenibacillus sp. MZ04-78.2]|uniref:sporulation protein Cse60 n=1 Tax=Paenibacillus sp. MZ04-78.2 TaxID=2962034 RepID=UPI0020B87423|nr:sporulation protein Cse60 [Paenibacillus sp. MZ04-78.2]MCP3772310.1 sporulation protein Cse60 [Paenibacillus sp. MZ04-78.2]
MIQVKEFIDSDVRLAEKTCNEFLSTLAEDQIVSISYGSIIKSKPDKGEYQRSTILVVYRTRDK